MEKCNKIVIFDWGGVIENNNQFYYNISKAIIDITPPPLLCTKFISDCSSSELSLFFVFKP